MAKFALGSAAVSVLLAAVHLALAWAYAAETPYRSQGILKHQGGQIVPDIGAPDERQHANYLQSLLDGQGIPVLKPGDPNLYESYQSHQPPLYYFLALGWSKAVGVADAREPDAGWRLRALNGVIGGIGVSGIYFLALWGYGRRDVAFGAAAFAALLPMNVALSSAVTNDPMLYAMCSWNLALLVRGLRDGFPPRYAILVGLVCGLALVTKTNAIALVPCIPLAFLLRGKSEGNVAWGSLGISLLVVGAVVAPWWIRNTSLYGDPLAMKAFMDAFLGSPRASDLAHALESVGPQSLSGAFKYWTGLNDLGLGVGWWLARSYIGVFGYMDIFLPSAVYSGFLLGILGALGAASLTEKRKSSDPSRTDPNGLTNPIQSEPTQTDPNQPERQPHHSPYGVAFLNTAFFLLILAFFLRFNTVYFQAQARYLIPAIGPVACAVALGLARLGGARPAIPIGFAAASLFALNLYVLAWLPGQFRERTEPLLRGARSDPSVNATAERRLTGGMELVAAGGQMQARLPAARRTVRELSFDRTG